MEPRIDHERLQRFIAPLFEAAGVPPNDALVTAEAFVLQEMRGVRSHGLSRIPSNLQGLRRGRIKPAPSRRVLVDTGACALLDADGGLGMPACFEAMDLALARAKAYGIGMCAVRNSNHFLAAAPYCLRAVEAGCIGIACSNSNASMAYPGVASAVLGNGPFGYALPTAAGFPLVFDAAMTASGGKLVEWAREGASVPEVFTGLDAQGRVTTDPNAVLDGGTTLPIGAHKGAGLVLLIEVLTGVLAGGGFLHTALPEAEPAWRMTSHSQTCIAIDVGRFMAAGEFEARIAAFVADVKNHEPAPGEEILLPGERAHRSLQECLEKGVPLRPEIEETLRRSARRMSLAYDL